MSVAEARKIARHMIKSGRFRSVEIRELYLPLDLSDSRPWVAATGRYIVAEPTTGGRTQVNGQKDWAELKAAMFL